MSDFSWTNPAMFGLQVGSMLLEAGGVASQSRAQIKANTQAMGEIDSAIGFTKESSVYQTENIQQEYGMQMDKGFQQAQTMYDKLFRQKEEASGAQKFAYSGGVEKEFDLSKKTLQQGLDTSRTGLLANLQKQTARIEQWRAGEESRLQSEKRRLEAENKMLKKKDTFFEALGF